jgi:hypothetical protein
MKTIGYILGGLAVGYIAYFVLLPQIKPTFRITTFDRPTQNGSFIFGGKRQDFSFGKSGSVNSRNGYVLMYGYRDNEFFFDLYRNGNFVETLETI